MCENKISKISVSIQNQQLLNLIHLQFSAALQYSSVQYITFLKKVKKLFQYSIILKINNSYLL